MQNVFCHNLNLCSLSLSTAGWLVNHNLRILAENTGQPYEKIVQDTERDNYMTAEQAKAYGLIDAVVEKRQ